jgi:hypothetical protein
LKSIHGTAASVRDRATPRADGSAASDDDASETVSSVRVIRSAIRSLSELSAVSCEPVGTFLLTACSDGKLRR